MKQRLVVMNGSRILQQEHNGAWINQKVDKAGVLKPGIYNLHGAQRPDKTKTYDGVVIHADANSLYQQVGKNIVMHDRRDFDKVPDIGSVKSIGYDAAGKAAVSADAVTLSRGRSR